MRLLTPASEVRPNTALRPRSHYFLTVPTSRSGTAYAFVEYGTDLSSGRALEGNPTEYYRKAGSGMSLGVGLKVLGACRFEYARDCNAGKNSVLVNWGERF